MPDKNVLRAIYGLERVWLEHVGCEFRRSAYGFHVSSRHNSSCDFNYLLLSKTPSKEIAFPIVKIRQSEDKGRKFSGYLTTNGYKKTGCDDVQLVYAPSARPLLPPAKPRDPTGLHIEEARAEDWIKNDKYDLNRNFSIGDFSPRKLFMGKTVVGRVNLLRSRNMVGVFDLGIEKEHRGRGLGRWFLAELLRGAGGKKYFIQTWEENAAALKLYLSAGFKITDRYLYFSRA